MTAMTQPYLAPHPWDAKGKPPEPGQPYGLDTTQATPTATYDRFTDVKGRTMTWDEGVSAAADCIMRQGEDDVVERLLDEHATPEEVLVWLVDPETGEFAP